MQHTVLQATAGEQSAALYGGPLGLHTDKEWAAPCTAICALTYGLDVPLAAYTDMSFLRLHQVRLHPAGATAPRHASCAF